MENYTPSEYDPGLFSQKRKSFSSLNFTLILVTGIFFFGVTPGMVSAVSIQTENVSLQGVDLCALQKDYTFFTQTPEWRSSKADRRAFRSQSLGCNEVMQIGQDIALSIPKVALTAEAKELADELRFLLSEFPMASMVSAIVDYDREIVGLIVGIGKKESNWGKRTPKLNGEECYNFWGYRGAGDRGLTPDGYGCFSTPEAAVKTIGDRLVRLRDMRQSSTPERMIVWKCGKSCAGHSEESVKKWIADVDLYYRAIAFKP